MFLTSFEYLLDYHSLLDYSSGIGSPIPECTYLTVFIILFYRYWFRIWYMVYLTPMSRILILEWRTRGTIAHFPWYSFYYIMALIDIWAMFFYWDIKGHASLCDWAKLWIVFQSLIGGLLVSYWYPRSDLIPYVLGPHLMIQMLLVNWGIN